MDKIYMLIFLLSMDLWRNAIKPSVKTTRMICS